MAIFTWLRLIFLVIATRVSAISSPWRPLTPVRPSIGVLQQEATVYDDLSVVSPYDLDAQEIALPQEQSQCSLYKISMNQQFYFEYIHYKIDLPNIKEFTLCMWTKFHNHTNDHPLFSYAVADQPRGILSWVANTARSSYYMMNVDGHNLYRLNYPLRLNKWYHSCQSWNGRTGEWQIWVNDERVGRGFNNRLVGHVIKGGGIAISGQEQRQLGGGFLEGEAAPPGAGGMLGELTMVQLYNVALSAGKAHRNHKHHHAHHYEHDTSNNTPRPTSRPPVTGPPLPQSPFLTAGQINPQVKLNPGAPLQIVQNGVILRHPGLAVPKASPAQSFSPGNSDVLSTAFPLAVSRPALSDSQIFVSPLDQRLPTGTTIDAPYRSLFKREKKNSDDSSAIGEESGDSRDSEKSIGKRQTDSRTSGVVGSTDGKVTFVAKEKDESRTSDEKVLEKRDSEKKKRGLYQFSNGLLVDDGYAVPQGLDSEYFSGLTSYSDQLSKHEDHEDESEPAEVEVKQIMDICDGCAPEPFEKALIMGWRSVPKKVYSGALYLPAAQICKAF